MPAGVHDARHARLVRHPTRFLNGQGVHVGPQGNAGAVAAAPAQGGDDAMPAADIGFYFVQIQRGKLGGDMSRRVLFVATQFGKAVQMVTQGGGFG